MHMRVLHSLLFLTVLPTVSLGHLRQPTPELKFTPPTQAISSIGFEENKGQVHTTDGVPASFVRYRLAQGSTQLFLLESGIAYQFSRTRHPEGIAEHGAEARDEQDRLETFRMDMHLEGANPAARITTEGRSGDYTQYYNHDALDVHTYTKVIYHDVYPGIDWVVYTTEHGMKYDFVVYPGADPNSISLRFSHHEELSLDGEGNLIHGNRMGRFTEAHPVSFQDGKEIASRFVLQGDLLRFRVGNYDRTRTLTIDPARVWGTYYGGSGEDLGWTCATDASGNVYVSGFTNSTNAIAQAGYQNTNGGGADAFLVKFDANGTRQWGTYYGGDATDMAHHCTVDNAGNVYLAGATASLSGIASGGHQNTHGTGGNDAFLVKFDANGTRLWGTYYGGGAGERGFYCATDANGNVYLTGETASATQISFNGHQNTYSNGNEAFLVKFNATGTRLWGTYYGGTGGESGEACIVDGSGNVYLAGFTTSTGGIASGGHQNTLGGSTDAFLVKFNASGTRQWGTYYGSTDADNGWSCAVDASGNVYMAGNTASSTGIASGGHQNTYGGAPSDGFLVKFSTTGTRQWATYYGGDGDERAYSCAVDNDGDVFIGGHTSSQTGIASDGFQNSYGGGASDAFLAKFNPAGVRSWGTYYGGTGHDGGNYTGIYVYSGVRCAVDGDGNAFLTGSTTSASGIASNGQQNTYGGSRDGFLVKFAGDPGITTGSVAAPLCVGSPVSVPFTANGYFDVANTFTAEISDASGSFASAVDIGTLSGTASGTIDAIIPGGTPTGTGYRIRVVASDPVTIGEDNGADIEVTEPGSPCDDGDPETNGDVINDDCVCAGEPECSTVGDLQESEPNPDASSANALPYDTTISGSIGACSPTNTSSDQFHITPTSQGVLRVDACLSTTGTEPVDVTFVVSISTGNVVGTYTLQAGANDAAITSFFEFPCMGSGDYYIGVQTPTSSDCLHYAFSYTTIVPTFDNDPALNSDVAYDTYQDGQNGFHGEASTTDQFNIITPIDGRLVMEVQAEQASSSPGELQVRLYTTTGFVIKEWVVPSGANGVPDTTMISADCLVAGGNYDVTFLTLDCGTSYRWKYTVTPPVFAGDTEPNSSTSNAIVLAASTPGTGHLDFLPQLEGTGENLDYFRMDLPSDGVLHVNVEAEHGDAATDGTLQLVVMQSTGLTLATWEAPVGANSTPASSSFSLPCMGTTIPYYLKLVSSTCGVSYRISWSVSAPFYASDAEPNNYYDIGIPMDLSGSWYDGHIGFDNATDDDYYRFAHPGGSFSVTVSAEHMGTGEGTMGLAVMNSNGAGFGTFVVPVGGSSTPLTNTFTIADLPAGSNYSMYLSDVTCGVSYRIHCANDADQDGVCDGDDLCAGGPEPGTPCDDGNAGTVNDVITADCECEGDITTGVSAVDPAGNELRIWPNPTTAEVWIDAGAEPGATFVVGVLDLMGRTVLASGPNVANGQGQLVVDLSSITQGTYVIELRSNGKSWSRRIVKM